MTEFEGQTLDLLRTIASHLEAITKSQSGATAGRALTATDRQALALLLPAMDAHVGTGRVITASELIAEAGRDPMLHQALLTALGDDMLNSRKLGKFLARAMGYCVDGFVLERGVEMREGWLWAVVRVSQPAQTRKPAIVLGKLRGPT